jgi:Co/Zn/Cd efflux system component
LSGPTQEYQASGPSRTRRLAIVLALNLSLVTALVIVGLAAHSLAVLAAGVDYLADAAAAGGVAASGAIILGTDGWYWLDPAAALTIALIIAYQAQKLARRAVSAIRSS